MDLIFEAIIWIIGGIFKLFSPSPEAEQNEKSRTPARDILQIRQTQSPPEQKAVDVWDAHHRKQELLEKEFRAKAPK